MKSLQLLIESDYEYSGKKAYFAGDNPDDNPLPAFVVSKIRSNIRHGAQNTSQKWANALELVQKAYQVAANMGREVSAKGKPSKFAQQVMVAKIKIERPSPEQTDAWKQYEELIQFAVEELAKTRGVKGDWRMSSAMFHESKKPVNTLRVRTEGVDKLVETTQTLQQFTDDIISQFKDKFEIVQEKLDDGMVLIDFWDKDVRVKIVAVQQI